MSMTDAAASYAYPTTREFKAYFMERCNRHGLRSEFTDKSTMAARPTSFVRIRNPRCTDRAR
jgi:hypothetical protein